MKQLSIENAKVHVEMDYFLTGSVLGGTVEGGVTEIRSHFEVESGESEEQILGVIRLAKRGCFAESLVTTAVPLKSTFKLNGEEVTVPLEDLEPIRKTDILSV